MFKNKFIACITVGGEIVREEKQNVYLPYGTKFSLFFKNLSEESQTTSKISFGGREIPLITSIPTDGTAEFPISLEFEEDCELKVYWERDSQRGKLQEMTLLLKGVGREEQVTRVATTAKKKQCPSCGKKFKSSYSYCPYDGTYLI